jgi:hypothetical protein
MSQIRQQDLVQRRGEKAGEELKSIPRGARAIDTRTIDTGRPPLKA